MHVHTNGDEILLKPTKTERAHMHQVCGSLGRLAAGASGANKDTLAGATECLTAVTLMLDPKGVCKPDTKILTTTEMAHIHRVIGSLGTIVRNSSGECYSNATTACDVLVAVAREHDPTGACKPGKEISSKTPKAGKGTERAPT